MFSKLFSRLFRKHSFGLDISNDAIRVVELASTKNGPELLHFKENKIPTGIIVAGKIKDQKKFERILLSIKKDFKLKSVRVSLSPNLMNHVDDYHSVFKYSRISVNSFESQVKAIPRAVIKNEDVGTNMIVNVGKKYTEVSIVANGAVRFNTALDFGGDTIVNTVAEELHISFNEAEQMKNKRGLKHNNQNKEIFKTISSIVAPLRDNLSKLFLHWHTLKGKGDIRLPIKKIILCGSEANLIGLSEFLSVSLRTKVEMANVWVNIKEEQDNIRELRLNQSFVFAPALGAALRDFA